MKDIEDGGPAFPVPYEQYDIGMSLRQWYAGMAMQGWLSTFKDDTPTPLASLAKFAFDIADAMIAHEAAEKRDG